MSDEIVTTLRTMVQFTNAVAGGVCWRAADEIERLREMVNSIANAQDGWGRVPRLEAEIQHLRKDLELAIQVKQFVSFWWDDPNKVGECCAAWDNLPEEVRMWVLE